MEYRLTTLRKALGTLLLLSAQRQIYVMLLALDDMFRCTNAWAISQVALSLDNRG